MQKTAATTVLLIALASILSAEALTAQTADGSVNLAMTIVTFVLLGLFLAVIGFAAYRLVKKWSGGESD